MTKSRRQSQNRRRERQGSTRGWCSPERPRSLNLADVDANVVRNRMRGAPARRLRAFDVTQDIVLPLGAALARADDVARVAAAVVPALLAQNAEGAAADAVTVQRPRHASKELEDLSLVHVAVLVAFATDDGLAAAEVARSAGIRRPWARARTRSGSGRRAERLDRRPVARELVIAGTHAPVIGRAARQFAVGHEARCRTGLRTGPGRHHAAEGR